MIDGQRDRPGRGYESEQILPFGPWVDAFRSAHIVDDDAVLSRLNPAWRAELARLLPQVMTTALPAPTDDRLRLFESVAHLVQELGATWPTVLMLEDVHWADDLSLRLLAFVARRVRDSAVLILATAREEEPASAEVRRLVGDELEGEPHCFSVMLSPLSEVETRALVQVLVRAGSDDAGSEGRARRIWRISEGNPFMAVETLRALEEGTMPDDSTGLQLPARIRQIIARRLERLSPASQELAGVAAVIGREFDFGLLHRASGLTEREAAQSIEELVRRRVLRVLGERLDFAHDRIRDVTLAQRRWSLGTPAAARRYSPGLGRRIFSPGGPTRRRDSQTMPWNSIGVSRNAATKPGHSG